MKIFIVIPALNEAKAIGQVVGELKKSNYEVVVVNDGSSDATTQAAESAGAVVLNHLVNRGQGAALRTGIVYALHHAADIIVTFDADGQHDANDLAKLIHPVLDHTADVTLGSRFLHGSPSHMPFLRKLVLKTAVVFTKIASGLKVTDTHNGLRAFSREAIEKIKINQDRMAHASEILDEIHRNKLKFVEVPITINYSDYSIAKGQSSFDFAKILIKYIMGRLMR